MARYSGTSGADTFSLNLSQLSGSTVSGGRGVDTLKITNTGSATFSSTSFKSLAGIDVLDLSAHSTGNSISGCQPACCRKAIAGNSPSSQALAASII